MTMMSAYLRAKADRCRKLAEQADGWVIRALHEIADELEDKAVELERPDP